MSNSLEQFESEFSANGAAATIDRLIEHLTEEKQFDRLFDALCMKAKYQLGLSPVRPTSFHDVSEDHDEAFKEKYIAAARHVGQLLLDDGQIPQAWIYFRTIGEHDPIRDAIEAFQPKQEFDEKTEELIQIALYDGANPVKGLEMLLQTHGTCNTITAMDQALPNLTEPDRLRAASMMVNRLYSELQPTLESEVQQRMTMVKPGSSIRELIAGRDWLFEGGNYHIDVSHLNSVVRFARSLPGDSPELQKALELAEYGAQLMDQFQYGGEPPFDDFYPAHINYFKVILNDQRNESLKHFESKLQAAGPDDQKMIAYVMVDLFTRIGQLEQATELAAEHLSDVEDPNGFSFAGLCAEAKQVDRLKQIALSRNDVVGYVSAILSSEQTS